MLVYIGITCSILFIIKLSLVRYPSFPVSGQSHNFNKYDRGRIDTLKIPYDYDSIMHYSGNSFSKNGKPTIRSIKDSSRPLGQNKGFTSLDVQGINSLYQCNGRLSLSLKELARACARKFCLFHGNGALAAWPSGYGAGLEIWWSGAQVPLWLPTPRLRFYIANWSGSCKLEFLTC